MAPSADVASTDPWAGTIESINSCPYYLLLGMRVVSMGEGRAVLTMPVKPELIQIYGTAHGGAIASLADSAIAVALVSASHEGEKAITVELKVNFVSARKDGVLTAEASLFQRGRTIAGGEVEITDEQGRLVAKGIGTYHPMRVGR